MMPSKFKNFKNTIKHNFVCFGDIESQLIYSKIFKKKDIGKEFWQHEHLMSGYYLHCENEKYSKPVQSFDDLEEFRNNLIDELDYVKSINENILQYPIDMKNFNKEEFDNVDKCKHCDFKFDENYNNRKITLVEKVDKNKLKRIIDDYGKNNINEETQENLEKYHNNLNNNGEISRTYSQKSENCKRYHSDMFNEVRTSIIDKNCTDIDFVNSNLTIILYLAKKNNSNIPNIIKYAKERENILKMIGPDRKTAKKLILAILNGGYKNIYHKDKNINKFLKDIENQARMLHEYFFKNYRRIDDDKSVYNYLEKKFVNILMDYENKLLVHLYDYFNMEKIEMMTLIFDGILLLPKPNINIFDIEKYLYEKSEINMKISIKPFQDYYEKLEKQILI